jgi:hypothetical protein
VSSLHYPLRPWWSCAACVRVDAAPPVEDEAYAAAARSLGAGLVAPRMGWVPWPCEIRQRQLLGEYADMGAEALWWFMAGCALEAAVDLPSVSAAWLRWRFCGWVPWEPVIVGRHPVAVR